MKKIILSFAIMGAALAYGQHDHGWCGFDHQLQKSFEENPGSAQELHEFMMSIKGNGEEMMNNRTTYTIPCVVHVIHDGDESNISYDQIVSAIGQLNEDWQRENSDTSNTRNTAMAPFLPVAADMDIEFKLAKIDPNGDCTNGVERRYSSLFQNADDNVKSYNAGGLNAWDVSSYFNIWVVESIDAGVGGGGGIVLGYAEFPQNGTSNTYGLVIRHDSFGTMGTANGNERTLAHEVGHCMGLFHTFQGGCGESPFWGGPTNDCTAGGDYICDTPPVDEAHWSCGTTQDHCTTVTNNDFWGFNVYDQFENFMSYSPCQNMFSEGQKTGVYDVIASIGWMQNLISPANLVATGVNQPDVLCKAEFSSSEIIVCAGSSIDFTDESFFGVTGTTWTFTGGSPASSTTANPTVTYNTPGVYDVTLEVTDGSNTESTTKTAYITVLDNPGEPIPYHENFEELTIVPDGQNWMIEDEDGNEPWQLHTTVGYGGSSQCVWIDNFGETDETKDHLMSGPIDLSGVLPSDYLVFNFRYAYRKRSGSNDEWLRFYVSNDCGETWTLRKNIHGDDLSPESDIFPYEPVEGEWIFEEVTNINSTYFVSNFRFKFVFENDNGNNIYIDNINLYSGSMTSIDEQIADNLSVYPNPVTNTVQISMDVYDQAYYNITLTNALGQVVAVVYQGDLAAGSNKISYDMEELPQGVYFLNVESNGVVETTKVLKQ